MIGPCLGDDLTERVLDVLAQFGGAATLRRITHAIGLREARIRAACLHLALRGAITGIRPNELAHARQVSGVLSLTDAGWRHVRDADRPRPDAA